MHSDRLVFLGIVCVVCIVMLVQRQTSVWHTSRITGSAYYVKNVPDAERAADHLAQLDVKVRRFLREADHTDPRIRNIRSRWSGTLSETPDTADNVAYSLGKNSIFMCVREKNGSLADINTSMFVLLHELAHVSTDSYGHTKEFWRNMKYLLEVADEIGVYTYVDHDASTETLCGRVLGTNPLSCVKNKTCTSEKKIPWKNIDE
jgi:hypothetical protein